MLNGFTLLYSFSIVSTFSWYFIVYLSGFWSIFNNCNTKSGMKMMNLKLLLGTNKLEESIFKSSIAIIYIVLLFIVFQNVLTAKYNWFNYVNSDACTYTYMAVMKL